MALIHFSAYPAADSGFLNERRCHRYWRWNYLSYSDGINEKTGVLLYRNSKLPFHVGCNISRLQSYCRDLLVLKLWIKSFPAIKPILSGRVFSVKPPFSDRKNVYFVRNISNRVLMQNRKPETVVIDYQYRLCNEYLIYRIHWLISKVVWYLQLTVLLLRKDKIQRNLSRSFLVQYAHCICRE